MGGVQGEEAGGSMDHPPGALKSGRIPANMGPIAEKDSYSFVAEDQTF